MTLREVQNALKETREDFFPKVSALTIVEQLEKFCRSDYRDEARKISIRHNDILKTVQITVIFAYRKQCILSAQCETEEVIKLEAFLRRAFKNVTSKKVEHEWGIVVRLCKN